MAKPIASSIAPAVREALKAAALLAGVHTNEAAAARTALAIWLHQAARNLTALPPDDDDEDDD